VHRRPPRRRARTPAVRPRPPRGDGPGRPDAGPARCRRRAGRPRGVGGHEWRPGEGAVMTLDLSAPRRVHIVGIGGMAMSGIAAVLTRLGHTVSGSDLKAWRGLEQVRLLGIDVNVPHDAARLPAELDA